MQMMHTRDNFGILSSLIHTKNAFFLRMEIGEVAHYVAGNRAARRILKSNSFQTKARELGLEIDLENMAVS
jgi:hypothetical protein